MIVLFKSFSLIKDLLSKEVLNILPSMSSSVRTLRSGTCIKTATSADLDKSVVNSIDIPKTTKKKIKILQKKELNVNAPNKDANIQNTDTISCQLEIIESSKKQSVSPRKRKQAKVEINSKKVKKEIKLETDPNAKSGISDIESMVWEPDNWKKVWHNILEMRKHNIAPVDSLGCEECPDKNVPAEVFRYQTLISVMLSSQTRDEVTHAASQRLIEHGLTVDNILKTSDEKIGELIYPAGFWKSKIKYIKQTTQILKDQYDGDIPRTFKELCKLPGVGPKMANIVMSVGWNDTVGIAVDTHVHRISNRLGWVKNPTKDPEQTRKALESWLPKILWKEGSLHLVGFGQTLCKPIKPKCQECLNVHLCPVGKRSVK